MHYFTSQLEYHEMPMKEQTGHIILQKLNYISLKKIAIKLPTSYNHVVISKNGAVSRFSFSNVSNPLRHKVEFKVGHAWVNGQLK